MPCVLPPYDFLITLLYSSQKQPTLPFQMQAKTKEVLAEQNVMPVNSPASSVTENEDSNSMDSSSIAVDDGEENDSRTRKRKLDESEDVNTEADTEIKVSSNEGNEDKKSRLASRFAAFAK